MIINKEYPATHSMSTAWYMVDADGNVGLMAFDDNGPVPGYNHVGPDLGLPDLIFGQAFSAGEECKGIHLNMSQIHELIGPPRTPQDIELWFEVCLAIEPEYTLEFLSMCMNKDIKNYGCISPEMNLYVVDAFDCIDSDHDNIIEGSTLDRMIKRNMIKAIYQVPELDVNSEYDKSTESVVFEKNFDDAPYYIYCQPYWTSVLQRRMNMPTTPVNMTQIDEEFRKKLLHVPVRFKDMENLQIAQWFVCNSNAPILVIDNAGYSLFPIDDLTNKYCLTNPFLFDFYKDCPEMGYYKCVKCNHECASTAKLIRTLTPTVLYVVAPTRKVNFYNCHNLPQEINDKSAVFSYVPKFPFKKQRCWMDIDNLNEQMTVEVLAALLSSSRAWFENAIRTINPQVIIIDDEALPVFPIADNEVSINNVSYPIFKESSVKDNYECIITLAKSPYRGQIFRMTYTEQEVEELKRDDKAFEL